MIDTKRDYYRNLGARIGESYYQAASQLEGLESGAYGAVPKRSMNRARVAIMRAAALDKARIAVDAAQNGGSDNITAIVVKVG